MENDNIILKCLGKTLKTSVKFADKIRTTFYNDLGKDIDGPHSYGRTTRVIAICTEKIFILDAGLQKIYEKIPYDVLSHIEVLKKPKDQFNLYLQPNELILNPSIIKISFFSDFKDVVINHIVCYFAVYFMKKYVVIRDLTVNYQIIEEVVEINKTEAKPSKIKKFTLNDYTFFILGQVKESSKNNHFVIKYDTHLNPNANLNSIVSRGGGNGNTPDFAMKNENDKLTKECTISIEIDNPTPLGKFDFEKDDRDISYYAYKNFSIYMKNILKVNQYWVMKNCNYPKKCNFAADDCQWEGWIIEAKVIDPYKEDFIFLYLRRKFLPPFFDSYQNFTFILNEKVGETFRLNPQANILLDTITGSLFSKQKMYTVRDSDLFLRAKIDSLLVDEDTLYFYQFGNRMIGDDLHSFGFNLLYNLFKYFEDGNMKENVEVFKSYLSSKRKFYEIDDFER